MNKSILLLISSLLVISTVSLGQKPGDYIQQSDLQLVENIHDIGFSPDQKHLVVLQKLNKAEFIVYEGYRMTKLPNVKITEDKNKKNETTLKSFAFSPNNDLLVVGSIEGAIYGFKIEEQGNKFNPQVQYTYFIGDKNIDFNVSSISINKNNQVAVCANNRIYILKGNDETKQFDEVVTFRQQDNVKFQSVAFNPQNGNQILVGGADVRGVFAIYKIDDWASNPVQIDQSGSQTLAVAFLNDGVTVVQARLQAKIFIYKFQGGNWIEKRSLDGSQDASILYVDVSGEYIGTEVKSRNRVIAWRLDAITESNLQSSLEAAPQVLNSTGSNLAFTKNANLILITPVDAGQKTLKRWTLCKSTNFLDDAGQCSACKTDTNTCGATCLNTDICLSCQAQYFLTDDYKCQSCSTIGVPGCKTCENAGKCNTCFDDETHNWKPDADGNGKCQCKNLFYPSGESCLTCSTVSNNHCIDCTDANTCKLCKTDGHIRAEPDEQNQCVCIDTYYFDGDGVCQLCSQQITGCVDCKSATQCTRCNKDGRFVPDASGDKCVCGDGYFYNTEQKKCLECKSKVDGCQKCDPYSGKCLKCSQQQRIPNPAGDACICQDRTWEDDQSRCQACPLQRCIHCENDQPHDCTQCDTAAHWQKDPINKTCVCERGYLKQHDECISCNIEGCDDCAKPGECDSCMEDRNFKPDPQNNKCVCKQNYYPLEGKQKCQNCSYIKGCLTCDNLTECTQCNTEGHFVFNEETKKCKCQTEYFEQGSQCKSCPATYANCQHCNKEKCLTCKQSYAYDTEDKQCKLCSDLFTDCQSCTVQKCSACKEGFDFNEEEGTCSCPSSKEIDGGKCVEKSGLSALAILAIIVGILALAGGAVAIIKCFKKRQSPLEDDEYEALEGQK